MKYCFTLILVLMLSFFVGTSVQAQTTEEPQLLFNWHDETLIPSFYFGNAYNEVWGFVQNNREYAVIGSERGTHIFDVTDPSLAYEAAFVAAPFTGEFVVHRDYHDYNGYLYIVCDEGVGTSTLQIVDLSGLPNSVEVVYDSMDLFTTSHNIFIDSINAKLYACVPRSASGSLSGLKVYDIGADPTDPQLLSTFGQRAHDVYVRNDTVFINGEGDGFFVISYVEDDTTPTVLGSITDYSSFGQGYNHSGWLSDDGNYYIFADENHGMPMKVVDVSDFSDMEIIATISSEIDPNSIPHNQIIRDNYLFVSYYHDGLQVFDISNPYEPTKVAEYNTYFAGDHDSYRGAWGVYPYLPSGNILVSDMQTGLYVIDVHLFDEGTSPVGISPVQSQQWQMYATSNQNTLLVAVDSDLNASGNLAVFDLNGRLIATQPIHLVAQQGNQYQLPIPATYHQQYLLLRLQANGQQSVRKIWCR